MGRTFDIGKYANQLAKAQVMDCQIDKAVNDDPRDIEAITTEIIQLKQDAGNAIIGIGQRLIEAKAMLSHGEWLPWLTERVEFSESTAQRFMRLAREWSNPSVLTDLGATKALTLLALPPEERESFMAENNVIDMTSRELEKAIRERDEARTAAEAAQADARSAEESRAQMEADMRTLEGIHRAAQESEAQARDALAKAQAELKELRERPVDVAVQPVVDEAAVAKAREDAIAEMQAKVDKAEAAAEKAEKKRKEAESALKKADAAAALLRRDAENAAETQRRAEKAEQALADARKQLANAAKSAGQAAISSDADLTSFKFLFDQAQGQVNQLHGLLLKVRGRDETAAVKLREALLALSDAIRRCAE